MKFIDKEENLIMWILLLFNIQMEFISTSCDLNNNDIKTITYNWLSNLYMTLEYKVHMIVVAYVFCFFFYIRMYCAGFV
jgi:hypothetical protein